MLIVSIALYLFITFLLCRVYFQRVSIPIFLMVFFIAAFSINILSSEILSLLHLLNSALSFLATQIILCGIIFLTMLFTGKINWRQLFSFTNPLKGRLDFWTVALLLLCCGGLGVLFFVGIKTPPDNLDSLHTHLVRVFYWLQHGSFQSWVTNPSAQITYPINANIQGLWLFLMSNNENLFFLVPWFSLVIICVSIYKISRLLKLTIHQSLIGCLVMLTIPVAVLQAFSYQNDLAVTALICVFLCFLFSYFSTKEIPELVFSLLALSLALGVKQTAFMVLPAIFLLVTYQIIKKEIEKKHLPYFGLIFIFFMVFSSYKYIQNMSEFNSFFGSSDLASGQTITIGNVVNKAEYNVPRYLFQMIDFEGLSPQLSTRLTAIKTGVFQSITGLFKVNLEDEVHLQPGYDPSERFIYSIQPPLTEDTSWFGPLCFLITILSIVIVLVQKNRQRKGYLLFALLLSITYFTAIFLQRPGWDPYQGRYFVLGIVPLLPLAGVCLPQKKVQAGIGLGILSLATIYLSFSILFLNASKPIITARTIVHLQNQVVLPLPFETRIQKIVKTRLVLYTNELGQTLLQRESILNVPYYDQLFYSTTKDIPDIEMVNSALSADQSLYLMIPVTPLEYALFGVNRTRDLFPINDASLVPINSYLLASKERVPNLPGFKLITSDDLYSLYLRIN